MILRIRRARPEHRINSQFVHFVNQDNEIVAEYLAQSLVDHRNVRLAAKAIAEFPLHHAKCGFDIRTLVIVLQKVRPPERKVVVHFLPRSAAIAFVMR